MTAVERTGRPGKRGEDENRSSDDIDPFCMAGEPGWDDQNSNAHKSQNDAQTRPLAGPPSSRVQRFN